MAKTLKLATTRTCEDPFFVFQRMWYYRSARCVTPLLIGDCFPRSRAIARALRIGLITQAEAEAL